MTVTLNPMPWTAFSVDRASALKPGMVLDVVNHKLPQVDAWLQPHIDELFPKGFSRHGESYFLNPQASGLVSSPNIELVFEYARRARFEERPSRFESVFGCETLKEADTFRSNPDWGQAGAPIWELETPVEPFRADMTCLTIGGSILIVSQLTEIYWSGRPNPLLGQASSVWELLLSPPVKVVAQAA